MILKRVRVGEFGLHRLVLAMRLLFIRATIYPIRLPI